MTTDHSSYLASSVAPWLVRWRWPIIGLTLVVTVYYAALVALMPHPGFDFEVLSTGEIVVYNPAPGSMAAARLQDGDIILAVDGWPTRQVVDWHWLFPPQAQYTYQVQRTTQMFTVTLSIVPMPFDLLVSRLGPYLVALTAWAVGALILSFAVPTNREAWRVGYVLLGISLTIGAASGTAYFVPGSYVGYRLLAPIVTTAFAQLALLPRASKPHRAEQIVWNIAYGIAIILSLTSLIEQWVLFPQGLSLSLGPVSLAQIRLAYLALCLLTNPAITVVRYWRAPRSHLKQQLRILLGCSLIAILPVVLVLFVPNILNLDTVTLFGPFSYELPLWCLILIPAAYGYVIYRHQYLNLDFFITRTLAVLLVGLSIVCLHAIAVVTLGFFPDLKSLEPLPSLAVVLASGLLVPAATTSSLRLTERLLYGRHTPDQQVLLRLTHMLAANPDLGTLNVAIDDVLKHLQVRQAALWLVNAKGEYISAHNWRTPEMAVFPSNVLPVEIITRTGLLPGSQPGSAALEQYPWIEALAPIRVADSGVGLLALGPRIPDQSFTAYHLAFVRQACEALGVAAHAIQLFEASRAMSRELLQVQNAERTRLAAEIHDDPLQRISYVANALGRIADEADQPAANTVDEMRENQATLYSVAAHLRGICDGLRPPVFDAGLDWTIREVAQKFKRQYEAAVHTQIHLPDEIRIPGETTLAMHHIVTEALHNIRKHARAGNVWIVLTGEADRIQLSVADDGCGAQLENLSLATLVRAGHFGIVGMHEWARLVQGTLTIAPRGGGGTVVTLTC